MLTVGRGKGIIGLFNARARHVTARTVKLFRNALPEATVLVSEDFEQAQRHARSIARERPAVLVVGGGDGSIAKVLNLVHRASGGWLPVFGVLRLGTGNAWSRVTGADPYVDDLPRLRSMPWPLPTRRFHLIEVEDTLCQFAGVGWDARMINDYLRNLDRRSAQLIGSRIATRLHRGMTGYLYSMVRYTIPEETALLLTQGPARARIENLGEPPYGIDSEARPQLLIDAGGGPRKLLYDGAASVAAAATEPEWGYGFRAFPFAELRSGFMNLRVYDRSAIEGAIKSVKLFRGEYPMPGMHDFLVTHARMTFSRPMPFQIAGDGLGTRESVEFRVSPVTVDLVDWSVARSSAVASA